MEEISSSRKRRQMAMLLRKFVLFVLGLELLMWLFPSLLSFLVWLVFLALITILALAIPFYLISMLWPKRFLPEWWRTGFSSTLTPSNGVPPGVACHLPKYVDRALRAYANQPGGVFRYVDRFWLEGGVFGWVEDSDAGVLCVTFRGTSEFGNWFLTNAQAHMVKAEEVFKDASVKGGVHQGFVKAYRDLWHASPKEKLASQVSECGAPDDAKEDSWTACNPYGWKKWLLAPLWCALFLALPMYTALYLAREKGLPIFGPPPAFSEFGFGCLILGALALLVLAQLGFAFGRFERRLQRRDRLFLGPALSDVVRTRADKMTKIVFIGHSLGGALATLAFVDYLTQPSNDTKDMDIELVTFGAPQVGNDEFGDWLRDLPEKHKVYIVGGIGDPVPHLPPRDSFLKVAIANPSLIGAVLAAVYVVGWLPYAVCYRASLGSNWNSLVCWKDSPELGLQVSNHFTTYTVLK